jgi:hypothetical protein
MSFTPPHSHSRSVAGLGRLLVAVMISGDKALIALKSAEQAVDGARTRLTVWFPNDEQWPTDAEDNREVISALSVANGEVKHARLMLDGVKVSRAAGLDFLTSLHEEVAACSDRLFVNPYTGKGGKTYMAFFGEGDDIEHRGQTHRELRDTLRAKIKKAGLDPVKVQADHGYGRGRGRR